jgi:hypothetical protein
MSITKTILIKSLVNQFYRQNAGLFAFLVFIMVAAVGRANGVGLLEYHLSLMEGIMTNRPFLLFVLAAWLLYALKCAQFMAVTLRHKDYGFLSLVFLKKQLPVFGMLLLVQFLFLLPILVYAFLTVWVALVHHWWPHIGVVFLFFLLISFGGAFLYQQLINHPEKRRVAHAAGNTLIPAKQYWVFLLRHIGNCHKILFVVIKCATCLILYGLLYDPGHGRSNLQMVILFYSFALLGHGVLIYSIRAWEESHMAFYRGLPVSMTSRFLQYGVLHLLLLIPEMITLRWLTPVYIGYGDAGLLIFFGWSILLFLNSMLFIQFFKKFDYLKIVTGLFLLIFIVVLTGTFPVFCGCLFLFSGTSFLRYYYRFEKP